MAGFGPGFQFYLAVSLGKHWTGKNSWEEEEAFGLLVPVIGGMWRGGTCAVVCFLVPLAAVLHVWLQHLYLKHQLEKVARGKAN